MQPTTSPPASLARPSARHFAGGLPFAGRRDALGPAPRRHRQPSDFFCPLPGNGANKVPTSTVRRHRSRSVGPGRGFCFSGAAASPALWQPLRGEGVVPPDLRPDATTPAPPNCSFCSVGIIWPAHASPSRIMPRQRHPTATAWGWRRFGLPAPAPVQARRRFLPRPVPAPSSSTVTHARGTKFLPARRQPAAARYAHDSLCLPRFRPDDSGGNAAVVRCCRSVGVNRPGACCSGDGSRLGC